MRKTGLMFNFLAIILWNLYSLSYVITDIPILIHWWSSSDLPKISLNNWCKKQNNITKITSQKQNKKPFAVCVDGLWVGILTHISSKQFTVLPYLSLPAYPSKYLLLILFFPRIFNLLLALTAFLSLRWI